MSPSQPHTHPHIQKYMHSYTAYTHTFTLLITHPAHFSLIISHSHTRTQHKHTWFHHSASLSLTLPLPFLPPQAIRYWLVTLATSWTESDFSFKSTPTSLSCFPPPPFSLLHLLFLFSFPPSFLSLPFLPLFSSLTPSLPPPPLPSQGSSIMLYLCILGVWPSYRVMPSSSLSSPSDQTLLENSKWEEGKGGERRERGGEGGCMC